jgi:hypothetical protein
MASAKMDNDSTDFPAILSDEEFEALRTRREQAARSMLGTPETTDEQPAVAPSDGRPESTIEQRFPHVAKMLVAMWPSDAFALYVKRMIVTDRETRAGFPREVLEDLLLLEAVNDAILQKTASRRPGYP